MLNLHIMEAFIATPSQLGPILQDRRKQRGLTQAELGSRVGLIQSAVARAEGHPERMTTERLFRLLSGLGLELVLRDRAEPEPSEW